MRSFNISARKRETLVSQRAASMRAHLARSSSRVMVMLRRRDFMTRFWCDAFSVSTRIAVGDGVFSSVLQRAPSPHFPDLRILKDLQRDFADLQNINDL